MTAQQKTLSDHVDMMEHRLRWPVLPYLPVIRDKPGQEREHAVMYANDDKPAVYDFNLFDLPETLAQLKERTLQTYENAQAVVNDGWRVD